MLVAATIIITQMMSMKATAVMMMTTIAMLGGIHHLNLRGKCSKFSVMMEGRGGTKKTKNFIVFFFMQVHQRYFTV